MNNLTYLTYFLDNYWNQMADEIYGSIGAAATAFLSESDVFRDGLISDLQSAVDENLLASDYFSPVYDLGYWSQFQRVINTHDAKVIRSVIVNGERH